MLNPLFAGWRENQFFIGFQLSMSSAYYWLGHPSIYPWKFYSSGYYVHLQANANSRLTRTRDLV